MKIAIPTNDETSISQHFGRSAAFLIYDIEGGKVTGREVRKNGAQHAHAQGECDHSSPRHESHSHAGILASLAGCELVICAGMGQRAADALKGGGIRILVVPPAPAEETLRAYLAGSLSTTRDEYCHCKH